MLQLKKRPASRSGGLKEEGGGVHRGGARTKKRNVWQKSGKNSKKRRGLRTLKRKRRPGVIRHRAKKS